MVVKGLASLDFVSEVEQFVVEKKNFELGRWCAKCYFM